jgi:hypothetical protein
MALIADGSGISQQEAQVAELEGEERGTRPRFDEQLPPLRGPVGDWALCPVGHSPPRDSRAQKLLGG